MTKRGQSKYEKLIYDFIVEYKSTHDGLSPSFRDIANHIEVKEGISIVRYTLFSLEKKGLIQLLREPKEIEPGAHMKTMAARGIMVVGGKWTKE